MKRKHETQITSYGSQTRAGSALILTVVLTSLLAVVGVMFVMVARVNKIATSAISENRELDFAVETVIAQITQELVLDSPNDVPGLPGREYYDYPGPNDLWLASLEPYELGGNYYWRQISDVNGFLNYRGWLTHYMPVTIIEDHNEIALDPNGLLLAQRADADGDGVADSKWIELDGITSSKGKPIYAAVRIVDNGGMLNVNTAYKFDPCDPCAVTIVRERIDGSSQMQINLMALAGRPYYTDAEARRLLEERTNYPVSGLDPNNLRKYEKNVVWRYNEPNGTYTPFDISDELELRNRFLLNHRGTTARLEEWGGEFKNVYTSWTPFRDIDEWFISAYDNGIFDPNYAYRHIATACNMDRIIDTHGDKMININKVNSLDVSDLYYRLTTGSIDPNMDWTIRRPIERRFAQLAVNIADFADRGYDNDGDGVLDDDSVTTFVTTFIDPCEIAYYYGFEAQPFISEIAFRIGQFPEEELTNFYAVELYNPFNMEIDMNDFQLEIAEVNAVGGVIIDFNSVISKIIRPDDHFVIVNNFVGNPFSIWNRPEDRWEDLRLRFFGHWKVADKSKPPIDSRERPDKSKPPIYIGFEKSYNLFLRRRVIEPVTGLVKWIYVDKQLLNPYELEASAGREAYFARDDYGWRIVYQTLTETRNSLGRRNYIRFSHSQLRERGYNFSFFLPNPLAADPGQRFITVGDVPRVLAIGHGIDPNGNGTIGQQLQQTDIAQEGLVRLDLQNPYHRNVFQYLTVFDPTIDGIDNNGNGLGEGLEIDGSELKIPGRININTAPWYVIAQLPWMTERIAQAIVAYRDKLLIPLAVDYFQVGDPNSRELATGIPGVREDFGFASIGELNFVIAGTDEYSIAKYLLDGTDLSGFPDLTTDVNELGDGILNDFEERDVIFSRISNLVTVRSDVFTAYILVRIGADGPQKRVIAILDRSDIYSGRGRVKVIALHYVPDPR